MLASGHSAERDRRFRQEGSIACETGLESHGQRHAGTPVSRFESEGGLYRVRFAGLRGILNADKLVRAGADLEAAAGLATALYTGHVRVNVHHPTRAHPRHDMDISLD